MSEEAKWYVAHTYSGYEEKVKTDLEKTVKNRNLQDMRSNTPPKRWLRSGRTASAR